MRKGKLVFLVISALQLSSCSQLKPKDSQPGHQSSDLAIKAEHFENLNACVLVFDQKSKQMVGVYGEARCNQRMPAASTFKVPLAVMAFDAGVLTDENTPMKWDGVFRSIESWNQDQTASSWMKNSVVWYSQRLTPKLGISKIKKYLKDFNYGNEDMSGGLTKAWLTITKFDESGLGTLKISAFEEMNFMRRFWIGDLQVNPQAITKTKELIRLEDSPRGYKLSGKTGSGYLDDLTGDFGWFVGHLEGNNQEFFVVTTFTRKARTADAKYPGLLAKEITKEIFKENSLW